MIIVERLKEANEQGIADINLLLPQLRENPEEHQGSLEDLQRIVDDENVALVVAKNREKVIGIATLYMITKFGKRTAYVEDVVVDDAYRGQGIGEKIMRSVIDVAKTEQVRTIHLTSRPERIAGNKLYQKLGFEQKKTNVYSLKL